MSSIILDRLVNQVAPSEACDPEQEIEEDNLGSVDVKVDSRNYLISLYKEIKNCNSLLGNIVKSKGLDYIVIGLFKNNNFSFGLKEFANDFVCEYVRFSCEDKHILNYIDNEELPPILIDVIELYWFKNVYLNGCIIAEIRDYRSASANSDFFNSYFILLKQTSLSLYNDIKKMVGLSTRGYYWNNDARFELESKLIYLTSPKLCLDPDPCIGLLSKRLSRKKLILCDKQFLRVPRRRYKNSVLSKAPSKEFKLLDFLKVKKPRSLPRFLPSHQAPKEDSITPSNYHHNNNYNFVDIQTLAKELPSNLNNNESDDLVKAEEYVLENLDESQNNGNKNLITRLAIFKRPSDNVYFGKQVLNKSECSLPPDFCIGDELQKKMFVKQFLKSWTVKGTKRMKITKQIENQEPVIEYTEAEKFYRQNIAKESVLGNNSNLQLAKRRLIQQRLSAASGNNSAVLNSLLMRNNIKVINNNGRQANSNASSDHLVISPSDLVVLSQNGNSAQRNMIDQVQNKSIRLSNMISSPTQRFNLPTSTRTLNASRNSVNVVASIANTDSSAAGSTSSGNTLNMKNESDNGISVAYLSPNIFMSGSTIYTVRPSTSSSSTTTNTSKAVNEINLSNQQQQQQQNSFDNVLM